MKNKKYKLYIHVGQATHFLKWEIPEYKKYFKLVDAPGLDTILLSFGPDVLDAAADLPALARFAVLFPGFNHNPLHDLELRRRQIKIIKKHFTKVFINRGPLEIAYKNVDNVEFYPFSVDIKKVRFKRYRTQLRNLIHVSSNSPQKDWERSEAVMRETQLPYEVFPPRNDTDMSRYMDYDDRMNNKHGLAFWRKRKELPWGYLSHELTIKKYNEYDAFVHVAKDVRHPKYLDGMYTASLIEAGLTGALIFWHDSYGVGGYLKSVFEVSSDPVRAAAQIKEVASSVNIEEHSKETRKEMLETFNPKSSVKCRADLILESVRML